MAPLPANQVGHHFRVTEEPLVGSVVVGGGDGRARAIPRGQAFGINVKEAAAEVENRELQHLIQQMTANK